jgi:hypothetical protein
VAPPVPARPVVTNGGACRVDLTGEPPGDAFEQLTVTGYKVLWFQPEFRTRVSNLTVGRRLSICLRLAVTHMLSDVLAQVM